MPQVVSSIPSYFELYSLAKRKVPTSLCFLFCFSLYSVRIRTYNYRFDLWCPRENIRKFFLCSLFEEHIRCFHIRVWISRILWNEKGIFAHLSRIRESISGILAMASIQHLYYMFIVLFCTWWLFNGWYLSYWWKLQTNCVWFLRSIITWIFLELEIQAFLIPSLLFPA